MRVTFGVAILSAVATLALLPPLPSLAQPADLPRAIYADPEPDAAHPAHADVLYIPSGGVNIHGLVYAASGPGPHPTLIILHGWPGNEKNLDLARSAQRAGWHAVTFNYRGSWGSPGDWSFQHCLEDVQAVLAYLRRPENAAALGIDPTRIVLVGHSLGGWLAAKTGSMDTGLLGVGLISAADLGAIGRLGQKDRPALLKMAGENRQSLTGTSPDKAIDELMAHAGDWGYEPMVPGLLRHSLLVLSSDDGMAPDTDHLVAALKAKGSGVVTAQHVATDHGWSDHRIQLQALILRWLEKLNAAKPGP